MRDLKPEASSANGTKIDEGPFWIILGQELVNPEKKKQDYGTTVKAKHVVKISKALLYIVIDT